MGVTQSVKATVFNEEIGGYLHARGGASSEPNKNNGGEHDKRIGHPHPPPQMPPPQTLNSQSERKPEEIFVEDPFAKWN